jgi:uncharacterized spore protein YtfJ
MERTGINEAMEQASQESLLEKVIEGIIGQVIGNAGSRTVFGDPVREEDRTIIPVARVTYRFGFGAGSGPPVNAGEPVPGGGGGGGDLHARPVGFIETTSSGSRFVPAIDWSQILSTGLTFAGIGMLMMLWRKLPER